MKQKIKKKLISAATSAIIAVGVIHHDALVTAFATSLDFKLLDLLKHVLLQFYHLLF